MQQEDDPQRFENIHPCLCGGHIDIRIVGYRLVIEQLRCPCGNGGHKAVELQRVDVTGKFPHIPFYIGGEIGE